jgi:hypothetical protein
VKDQPLYHSQQVVTLKESVPVAMVDQLINLIVEVAEVPVVVVLQVETVDLEGEMVLDS